MVKIFTRPNFSGTMRRLVIFLILWIELTVVQIVRHCHLNIQFRYNRVTHCLSGGPRLKKRSTSNSILFVIVLVSIVQKVRFLNHFLGRKCPKMAQKMDKMAKNGFKIPLRVNCAIQLPLFFFFLFLGGWGGSVFFTFFYLFLLSL